MLLGAVFRPMSWHFASVTGAWAGRRQMAWVFAKGTLGFVLAVEKH
jgi:hypothetical protein